MRQGSSVLHWPYKELNDSYSSHVSGIVKFPPMDSKTLHVLEYDKILERLARFCDFSASADLARALQPSNNFDEVTRLLAETTEARPLISTSDLSIGGSHDIRASADLAARG